MDISLQLVHQIERLFWDRPLAADDCQDYPRWVLKRVLEYGDLADVQAAIRFYGREDFLRMVSDIRFDSARTIHFWRQMLTLEGRSVCMTRHFRREAGKLWNV